jgi:hypothetical protein
MLLKFTGLGTDMLFALGMIAGIIIGIIIWLLIREDK